MKKRVLASMMCAVMFGACSVRAEKEYHEEDEFDMFRREASRS